MSYVRCVCGAVYNTVGTTTGMSGCCPKCGLHHSGQYRVAKPVLKPSPLAAKPINSAEIEYYVNYVMDEITKHDVDQVSERLRALGWEEVVRCRDCKHVKHDSEWQPDRRFKPVDMWTCHAEWCEGFEGDHPRVEPDGFCKWGERSENGA